MTGYCEWCGRRPSPVDRLLRRGIDLAGATGVHACARCRAEVPLLGGSGRRTISRARATPTVIVGSLVALVASIALVTSLVRPVPGGAVLGVAASATPGAPSDDQSGASSPVPTAGQTPVLASPARSDRVLDLAEGAPAVIAWTDSFDRDRLQIIVPVRNQSSDRIRISERDSGYRLMGPSGQMASGPFTALPTILEPGGTAYLVETRDDPSNGRVLWTVETTISAVRTEEAAPLLSLTALELDQGIGGGMRASGRVRNDGSGAAGPVTVGAIALGEDGRPLGAVADTHDIVRLPADESQTFATDVAAGAPTIMAGDVVTVIGVAFEP